MKTRPKKPTFEYIGISHPRAHKLFDVKSRGAHTLFSRGPQRLYPTLLMAIGNSEVKMAAAVAFEMVGFALALEGDLGEVEKRRQQWRCMVRLT